MKAVAAALGTLLICFVVQVSAAGAAGSNEKVLYSFCSQPNCTDGLYPVASLIDVNGTLYGTTENGGAEGFGTVFSLDPTSSTEKVVHSFGIGSDGLYPYAGLVEARGLLYGTTQAGGTGSGCSPGCGTVFVLDPKTGIEKVLYSFCVLTNCADGAGPEAALTYVNGKLYGTTSSSGSCAFSAGLCGTVFSFDLSTNTQKVLYSFCNQPNCVDGSEPLASLIAVNGMLYGTTFSGGSSTGCFSGGCGTVFAIDPNTGLEKVIYSFCSQQNCTDGRAPAANLIDVKGTLYGTTSGGGAHCSEGCGTVVSIDPDTGAEKVVHSLCHRPNCSDGAFPEAGLIDVRGALYGTASMGGARAHCRYLNDLYCGTVFRLNPNTGVEKMLHSFCKQSPCKSGDFPAAGVIDVGGTLYGTTEFGGTGQCRPQGNQSGCGTVYAVSLP
jgi:uncharacterized repeat protein (TIGR03803 family)